jgi:hypothetical protein
MSQKETIIQHINQYGSITPLEALTRYGIMRLAARVSELRSEGLDIVSDLKVHDGRRYASYRKAGAA